MGPVRAGLAARMALVALGATVVVLIVCSCSTQKVAAPDDAGCSDPGFYCRRLLPAGLPVL